MASLDVAPGSVFAGSYRVVELLGHGEMGTAYLVETLPAGTRCVLKTMDASVLKHDSVRKTFVTLAKSTSRVTSAHVLQTIDAGIDRASGRPWFTTDFLPGEDLASRVARWGPQRLPDVRVIVAALGDALGKAHAEGLVHYDLTPENIHLGSGKPFGVTLRELTISRLVSDACAAEGDVFGSAIWMAPEQFDIGRPLVPAANLWSLALIAFYAATGRPYWLRASDHPSPSRELLREILFEPIASASERAAALGCNVALPQWFDRWFASCVTRDPSGRFPKAKAAHTSFGEHLAGAPSDLAEKIDDDQRTTTRLPPRPPRVKGSRSLPRGVLADAKGGAAEASMTPPPAATAARASTSPPRATTAKRGHRRLRNLAVLGAGAAAVAWLWSDRMPSDPHSAGSAVESRATSTQSPSSVPAAAVETASAGRDVGGPPSAVGPDAAPTRTSGGTVAVAGSDGPGGSTDFDLAAALKSLNAVYYGNCAIPSAGRLAITFAPSGRVKKVTVLRGEYDEQTTTCVAARFGTARVVPFQGNAQTVTADVVATR
jgi:serine/threonine protein kinase